MSRTSTILPKKSGELEILETHPERIGEKNASLPAFLPEHKYLMSETGQNCERNAL